MPDNDTEYQVEIRIVETKNGFPIKPHGKRYGTTLWLPGKTEDTPHDVITALQNHTHCYTWSK